MITCPPIIRTIHEVASSLERRGLEADCADVVQVLSEDELIGLVPNYDAWIIGDDPATYNVLAAGKNGKLQACKMGCRDRQRRRCRYEGFVYSMG